VWAKGHEIIISVKAEQLELMKALGCGQIQGYFFSRPLRRMIFWLFIALISEPNSPLMGWRKCNW